MMFSGAKQNLLLAALLLGMALLNACENDLNKIKEISAKQSTNPIQRTTGVDVIYSDSARVKLRMLAPLLLQLDDPKKPENEYDEMPKGVKIIFYDTARRESGSIVADSAVQHRKARIIEFHHNVVAVNQAGDVFRSDELIWDQVKKIMYSNKPATINMATGDVLQGVNFLSDDKLNNAKFGQSTATFYVTDSPAN